MPVSSPLILPPPRHPQCNDTRGDGTRLLLTVSWLDRFFHLTLVRVTETPLDAVGEVVASVDDPSFDHAELRADNDEDTADVDALWVLNDVAFETVRVPGFEGEYVAFMVPFAR